MKLITAGLLVALAGAPTFAAMRIVMESADLANNKVTPHEILIDATRMRVNDGTNSMIFLSSGGNRIVILDKARNEYREIDQKAMEQMAQQMQGVMSQMEAAMKGMPPEQRAAMEKMMKGKMPPAAAASAPAVITYTAKGPGIANGYSCTKYEGVLAGQKIVELCASLPAALKLSTADFQVYEKMQEFSSSMVKAVADSPLGAMMPGTGQPGIQGFPVEQITFNNGKAVMRLVLKSISEFAATDADFSTGNARKMEMGFPPAPGR